MRGCIRPRSSALGRIQGRGYGYMQAVRSVVGASEASEVLDPFGIQRFRGVCIESAVIVNSTASS